MIITGHQADLLPYSGFWYKMAKADMFDLKIFDQMQDRGYQRRVRMRDQWVSVPVVRPPNNARICDVRLQPGAKRVLADGIIGRYRGARYWDDVGPRLLAMIDEIETEHLWQLNLSLILGVRELLGIKTPIAISPPPQGRGIPALVGVFQLYGATEYLSGTGGRAYMGDCREFDEAGIEVIWSAHSPVTGDSIVSVLMDYRNPIDQVLTEHREVEGETA